MKALIVLVLFVTTSAFANITCKGAVEYTLQDSKALNDALTQDLNIPTVRIFKELQGLQYRVADVRLACDNWLEPGNPFCREFLRETAKRSTLITDGDRSFEEMELLVDNNQKIMNSIYEICFK